MQKKSRLRKTHTGLFFKSLPKLHSICFHTFQLLPLCCLTRFSIIIHSQFPSIEVSPLFLKFCHPVAPFSKILIIILTNIEEKSVEMKMELHLFRIHHFTLLAECVSIAHLLCITFKIKKKRKGKLTHMPTPLHSKHIQLSKQLSSRQRQWFLSLSPQSKERDSPARR